MFGFIGIGPVELVIVGAVTAAIVGGVWWFVSTMTRLRVPTKCPHCGKNIAG